MSDAFAPIVRARPNPIFGRPVHQGSPPFDYSPILLLKPFGFRITPDTLSSSEQTRWPTRHYPRLWIQRPSSERRRDLNPPDSCAAQRTLRSSPPLAGHRYFGLAVGAACAFSLAIAGQVLTFHTKAWSSFAPPTRRMPLGQSQDILRARPGRWVTPRFRHHLIAFRRFCSGSLALAS